MKKRIFSGAQPTGNLHIGNYLGALKNWVNLQNEYESFFCIVNMHAITLPHDPQILKQKTLDLARIYLAAGIDPEVSTVFIQSDVSEHAELTWILNCVARMGELERMTQFKDKSAKAASSINNPEKYIQIAKDFELEVYGKSDEGISNDYYINIGRIIEKAGARIRGKNPLEALRIFAKASEEIEKENVERSSVGLFTYPVLMAADILLYQTELVPIGQDQKQHLELTRDLAERFNRDFGETFVIPDAFIPPVGAKILSLAEPEKKMSKSDANANGSIFLLDDADTVTKKIKRAVTDSGTDITFDETRPAITNLLTIYHLLTGKSVEDAQAHFAGKGYGHFKTELAETIVEFLRPFQQRVKEFDDAELEKILKAGAEKARAIARETLKTVYEKTGIVGANQ
jgi:tryptophanyl-tRNA synthetase